MRYANFLDEQDVLDAFAVAEAADDARLLPPSWNIGPMQLAPIVTLTPADAGAPGNRDRRLIAARWGLVPTWAKDASMGAKMFNARSETVADKPAFRAAFAKRRCLVPASGSYEWQARGELAAIHDRQPVMLRPAERDAWMDAASDAAELAAVIASPAPSLVTRPVGTNVGNIRNNDPSLVDPAGA